VTVRVRRVRLRNYKSIAACDVRLGPFTALVGPNGSGKSNFLDALRFVRDALDTNLEHALRERGVLVALFQPGDIGLVGLEEPESAIHPGPRPCCSTPSWRPAGAARWWSPATAPTC